MSYFQPASRLPDGWWEDIGSSDLAIAARLFKTVDGICVLLEKERVWTRKNRARDFRCVGESIMVILG